MHEEPDDSKRSRRRPTAGHCPAELPGGPGGFPDVAAALCPSRPRRTDGDQQNSRPTG